MNQNAVELKNVNKHYKDFTIEDLNLNIKKGFVTGFVGRNGAGKSTTIEMIMNLTRPNSGEVKVFGLDISNNEKVVKDKIGYVDAASNYMESFKLNDIIKYVSKTYSNWDEKACSHYIKEFNLPLNKKFKDFSTGMRAKASIALALSHNAELFIMDEPTTGLDPVVRREIIETLREIMVNEDRTILFSTHITEDLEKLADYIVMIDDGEIILNTSKNDLAENYFIVHGSNDLLDRDTESYFTSIKKGDVNFEALTKSPKEVEAVFSDTVVIEPVKIDDIIYHLKGEK
ncbi:ABC transporter ATP-binding protein [Nosocomiicoccus massiliensis]|uniref:ABC transporter ATP-binding protein n=1 Tax=Nosocomiicoccus massiliensis TaxID=1232430 RepID=A0AAF1BNI1_9STAP|nr:ABC transporter ATP-binding protein [Nosocomiicoccus massiliensis]WOS96260.1 ABC transporter ATP-binding protein [Nosocomiicoccus massiliensis]